MRTPESGASRGRQDENPDRKDRSKEIIAIAGAVAAIAGALTAVLTMMHQLI
jgi:hypothetical protein